MGELNVMLSCVVLTMESFHMMGFTDSESSVLL